MRRSSVALITVAVVGLDCAVGAMERDPCADKNECAEMPDYKAPQNHVPERDDSDQTNLMYANIASPMIGTTPDLVISSTSIVGSRIAFGNGFLTKL